ncbi:MAG: tyrosine-type recombinase/integrase [Bacillota bacterium]
MVELMLHAGLRVSELCALDRDHIHISARAGKVCVTGKGNKYREVPLNSTVRKILQRWNDENQAGPLFPNCYGQPVSTRGVFKLVAEYGYRAKLEEVTPHTLRHTFCKNAVDMGIPIDQVVAMAGHSTLDILRRLTFKQP